ncbi:oxalate decarboxylase OxdD [Ktedonobacter sp. SOSP1-85]|uniref:cupin domain-containing protein n=1 Tax=Ktedonobacter sp. SOSP1-85 TaxID=2778367 RepID=UPI001A2B01A5|nr:cupin domain-containing protein [Ktedonobacter sp. SOSP1-85]GHO76416.1 oxalate decarboxylase OxdD [Ktedonobacter sp. SOSP1-85]
MIQSMAAMGVAAGVTSAVPGVTNVSPSGIITGLPLVHTVTNSSVPQPERNGLGGTDPGPRDIAIDEQNPDLLAPPLTDAGTVPNLKWPFSLSHNRLAPAGWARETTIQELPVSTEMAGVDMRLNPGAIRELHWHPVSEWGIVTVGSVQITCLDADGRMFVDNLDQGDLWFFPEAFPHSLQAFGGVGSEFILIFTKGNYSENDTFLLSDAFAHIPKDVLAKNFRVPVSEVSNLASPSQRYIYPGEIPPTDVTVPEPYGKPPRAFGYHMSNNEPVLQNEAGTVRIVDSSSFPVTGVSVGLVTINPGHMRELHWHPNAEWAYFLQGQGRLTAFASSGTAATFDYQAGDVGYVPSNYLHYVENTGDTPLQYMEVFRSPKFESISLAQWMGVTPPWLVQGNLNVSQAFMSQLPTKKTFLI